MKHVKTYEIFGFSTQEKTEESKKKVTEVLTELRRLGYDFKEAAADIMDDVWVYKGNRYIGISPKFADKKMSVHTLHGDENINISLTEETSEIASKIIKFIKTREPKINERKKRN